MSIHRHEIQRRGICQAGADMGGARKLKRWSQTNQLMKNKQMSRLLWLPLCLMALCSYAQNNKLQHSHMEDSVALRNV